MWIRACAAALLSFVPTPAAAPPTPPAEHSGILRDTTAFREVLPPARYQGDAAAIVIFAHRPLIEQMCGPTDANGTGPIACTGSKNGSTIMVVPNPCLFAEHDFYAAIVCHELGHVNGWGANHGD